MLTKLQKLRSQGFTIVETLIVLGVTGVMFLSTSLLVQGQIEKNRYQDSMRQLQQLVQNTINDTANGNMTATNGVSDALLVGKRFWFCADGFIIITTPANIECGPDGGSIMTVETVEKNGANLSYGSSSTTNLPGGLKFKYYKTLNSLGGALTGEGSQEFGAQASFTDEDGNVGADNAYRVGLFNRPAAYELGKNNALNQNPPANHYGRILCFEGYRMGSLELGSKTSGLIVSLNMEDGRCR